MFSALSQLVADHSLGFIAVAAGLCLSAAWLLTVLVDWLEQDNLESSYFWLATVAVVAGLGVWTTHFIAMLGYRADMLLSYDARNTAVSALMGIAFVGGPIALSTLVSSQWGKGLLGLAAGLGVGVMHFLGMAAVQGCTVEQTTFGQVLAFAIGGTIMAMARGLPRRFLSRGTSCLLFTLAVCGAHFTAMADISVTNVVVGTGTQSGKAVLTIFVALGAVLLFAGAFISLLVAQRFEMQEKAHSTVLATALHNMSNGLIFVDGKGTLKLFNARFLEQFSLDSAALRVEMPLAALLDEMAVAIGWDRERKTMVTRTLTEWMSKPRISRTEWELADKRILAMECRPLPDGGAVVTFDDVTVERRTQSQVAFMAFHDPLTGLANRRALKTRMEEGFDAANRFKLLLIDLDRFKAVNDTFGHGVGDRLLVEVSKRVRAVAAETGFVARIGGDELAVLVYGDNVVAMAAANEIVAAIGRPFELQGHHLSIGCSIGLCCTDDAEDVDSLMQRADLALYEAKRQGRGRVFCYVPGMLEKVAERTLLEYDLRTAVEKEQLVLHYQPVFDLQTQRLIAFEALIRWNHPTRGMVSPADFIPLAEEAGSILGIGQWVLETACRQASNWGPEIKIAVNVSPVQFRSPTLLVGITKALADAGLPAHRLEIELTETAIVEDGPQIARVLESLRNCGVTVAMDDFGTGYSSLAHFRDLPVDRIKIDRSFVDSAATDIHSMAVLKAITRLGQDVGISTLAEGVETEVQLSMLRAIGCDAAQGYHLGRPMLGADADSLVHQASIQLAKAG